MEDINGKEREQMLAGVRAGSWQGTVQQGKLPAAGRKEVRNGIEKENGTPKSRG